jgi:hypothetical protein
MEALEDMGLNKNPATSAKNKGLHTLNNNQVIKLNRSTCPLSTNHVELENLLSHHGMQLREFLGLHVYRDALR